MRAAVGEIHKHRKTMIRMVLYADVDASQVSYISKVRQIYSHVFFI